MSDGKAARRPPLSDFLFRLAQGEPKAWADRLRDDQRNRWLADERVHIEDYLDGLPALADQTETLLDLIYGEVLLRESFGEHPSLAELQERFPAHRETLARQWEVHQVLEDRSLNETRSVAVSEVATPVDPTDTAAFIRPSKSALFKTQSPPQGGDEPIISGYDILNELGRGGNGVVYLARQRSLNRLVAVKMIEPGRSLSASQVARIRGEAELIARLQHPNIVGIYRVGLCEGKPYLALEYVPGGSLAQRLDGQPWPAEDAAELVESLARTLAVVHEHGIVHRDLKPANVLMTLGRDVPKIVDFGLAKTLIEAEPPSVQAVTQTGELLGTPLYMAPEQAAGTNDRIGPATDQHALGAILYELLTGRPPFRAENAFDVMAKIAFSKPMPPSHRVRGISTDLDAIVLRCLAKEPAERYASSLELAEDLHRVRHGFPARVRTVGTMERLWLWSRRQPVVAGMMLAVLAALVFAATTFGLLWGQAKTAQSRETIARAQAEAAQQELGVALDAATAAHDKVKTALGVAKREKENAEKSLAEAQRQRLIAEKAGEGEKQAGKDRDERLARSLIALAETERLRHNFVRAREHLEGCDEKLREWEWYYLDRLCGMQLVMLDESRNERFVSTAISPDRRTIAGAVESGKSPARRGVRLWRADTGKKLLDLEGCTCVAFHRSGNWLATCGSVGGVLMHSLSAVGTSPVMLGYSRAGKVPYFRLLYSPNGQYLGGLREGGVDLWPLPPGGKPRAGAPLSIHLPFTNAQLRDIAFRSDNKVLAVAARGQVAFWDLSRKVFVHERARSGAQRPIRLVQKEPPILHLVWSPVGDHIVTSAIDGVLRGYSSSDLKLAFRLEGHAGAIEALSARGESLASVSIDGTARVWDLKKRQEILRLSGSRTIALDASGQEVLTALRTGELALWQARPTPPASPQTWHALPVRALAFSPTSRVLATGGRDKRVTFHDPENPNEEGGSTWTTPTEVIALAYHPRGRLLAAGLMKGDGDTPTLILRDVLTGRQSALPGHQGNIPTVAFSHDGRLLASAGQGGIIRLWQGSPDDPAWKMVRTLDSHAGFITGVAFDSLGRLASRSRNGKVILWNVETGKPVKVYSDFIDDDKAVKGTPGQLHLSGIAFSPDGMQAATAGPRGTVALWHMDTDEVKLLVGHTARVHGLAYSPDGKRLATSSADGNVRLWDPRRGEEVLTLTGHTRNVLAIAFSADGRFLATSARDKTVVIHDGGRRGGK